MTLNFGRNPSYRMRPIGIDLFSGAGGMSLGFEQAGFDVVAAVEIDPIHSATHQRNFPNCATICRSVVDLTGQAIRDAAGIGDAPVEVVFGGPPCQGFSMIGKRQLDDPRNHLVGHFVRLVRELDANYFVFENVKGLTVGEHVKFLNELLVEFRKAGYDVREPWRVLNAAEYGVPQDRRRLFLLGAKHGLRVPNYPNQMNRVPGAGDGNLLLPVGPTVGDALKDVPDAEQYDALISTDMVRVEWGAPSEYGKAMRSLSASDFGFGYRRRFDPTLMSSSLRATHTALSRERFASTPGGQVEPHSRFFKLPLDGISNTLRAGTDSARGAFTSPRPIHPIYPRCVTVREMARLHSFPDWFRFHVTKWHGARQIGNSVPPRLAEAVAAQIMSAGEWRPITPSTVLTPDDHQLLLLDMSDASEHFDVPRSVIAQRTRRDASPSRQQGQKTHPPIQVSAAD